MQKLFENWRKFLVTEGADFQVGDYVKVARGGLEGAAGKIVKGPVTLGSGEEAFEILLDTAPDDADSSYRRITNNPVGAGETVLVQAVHLDDGMFGGYSKEELRGLDEASKSKNQQKFMGMVKKCQETGDCASDEVKKTADSMKKSDVDDFARTKHKGLPDKVEDKK